MGGDSRNIVFLQNNHHPGGFNEHVRGHGDIGELHKIQLMDV